MLNPFKDWHLFLAKTIYSFYKLQHPNNKADINVKNRDGLTAVHILLARLMDLSAIDSKPIDARPKVFETDEDLQESIEGVMECLRILLEQPVLRYFQVPFT